MVRAHESRGPVMTWPVSSRGVVSYKDRPYELRPTAAGYDVAIGDDVIGSLSMFRILGGSVLWQHRRRGGDLSVPYVTRAGAADGLWRAHVRESTTPRATPARLAHRGRAAPADLPAHCSHGRPSGHRPPPYWRARESRPAPVDALLSSVAIDFDGVIHDHSDHPFRHPCHIDGPPARGAFALLRDLLQSGSVVWLHTARLCAGIDPGDTSVPELPIGVRVEALREWFDRNGGGDIVRADGWRWWTGRGKPPAGVYVDDRAVVAFASGVPTRADLLHAARARVIAEGGEA